MEDQGRFAVLGAFAGNFSRPFGPACEAYDFSKVGARDEWSQQADWSQISCKCHNIDRANPQVKKASGGTSRTESPCAVSGWLVCQPLLMIDPQ